MHNEIVSCHSKQFIFIPMLVFKLDLLFLGVDSERVNKIKIKSFCLLFTHHTFCNSLSSPIPF